jgi:hypothetical protein
VRNASACKANIVATAQTSETIRDAPAVSITAPSVSGEIAALSKKSGRPSTGVNLKDDDIGAITSRRARLDPIDNLDGLVCFLLLAIATLDVRESDLISGSSTTSTSPI